MRLNLSLSILALAVVAGCSSPSPASTHERALVTAELVASRPACAGFIRQLRETVATDQALAETYAAMRAAGCLRPDV